MATAPLTPRTFHIDVPVQPQALFKLGALLAEDDVNLQAIAHLIENDMALAAAVMKACNTPIYGIKGGVHSVQQAVNFLGMREIAAVTFEIGLRSVFPAAAELQAVWDRACVRGLYMGRLAQEIYMDAWSAHTAGLFEECGKAVLFKHAPDAYRAMIKSAANDIELLALEQQAFNSNHEAVGGLLCESWGLSAGAIASVRHHAQVHATRQLPPDTAYGSVCVLSAVAFSLMTDPSTVDEVIATLAPQAQLGTNMLLVATRKVKKQIDEVLGG
jgi:HD-like signal output (HDOD) protein